MKTKSNNVQPTHPKSHLHPRLSLNKQNIHPNRMMPSTEQQSQGDRLEHYPKVSCFGVPHSSHANDKEDSGNKVGINKKQDWRRRVMALSDREALLNNRLLQMLCRTSLRSNSPDKFYAADKVATETGSMVTNSKPSKSHSLLLSNSNSNSNQSNSNNNKLGNTLRRYLEHSSKSNTNTKLLHPHLCQYQTHSYASQLACLDEQQMNKITAISTELLPSMEPHNNNNLNKLVMQLEGTVRDITGFDLVKSNEQQCNPEESISNIVCLLRKYQHERDNRCPAKAKTGGQNEAIIKDDF